MIIIILLLILLILFFFNVVWDLIFCFCFRSQKWMNYLNQISQRYKIQRVNFNQNVENAIDL